MNSETETRENKARPMLLFVDDDPMAHKVVASHLREWPLESAYSGEEALEIINEKDIQIVITDIGMPGMDGLTLLKRIKQTRPVIQVIMATSSEEVQHLLTAFAEGANDFLLKPLKKRDVEEALENTLTKIERWKANLRKLFTIKKGEGNGD